MKFNCDRCKTRYSISDERVRGKVLKIRCKNCSAVITVREGMVAATAPKTPLAAASARAGSRVTSTPSASGGQVRTRSDSALRGAFDEAMSSPSASDSMTGPPATLTAEWYMAIDGEQSGPFDLENAKQWVSENRHHDEVYCWSEGFDDWLPVEKVSHFRALATGTNGGRARTMAGLGEVAEPLASSESTKRATTNGAGSPQQTTSTSQSKATKQSDSSNVADSLFASANPSNASNQQAKSASLMDAMDGVSASDAGVFEFDIGEASRVVNLASIMPPNKGLASHGLATPVAPSSPGLPGLKTVGADLQSASAAALPTVSGATSPDLEVAARPEILLPSTAKKRSKVLVPLLIASAALVLVLGILLFLAFRSDDSNDQEIARRGGPGIEDLAVQFDDPRGTTAGSGKNANDTSNPNGGTADKTEDKNGKGRWRNGNGNNNRKNPTNGNSNSNGNTKYVPPTGEVDLSGSLNRDEIRQGSLEWDDVSSVYRRKQFVVQRCYERAIKKNPLLRVGKATITLQIAQNGRVSKVAVPSLAREDLGGCLVASIGKWRFPKSTEGWNGKFPIVFRAN